MLGLGAQQIAEVIDVKVLTIFITFRMAVLGRLAARCRMRVRTLIERIQAGFVSRFGGCIVGNKAGRERKGLLELWRGRCPGPLWVGLWELMSSLCTVSKLLSRVSTGRGVGFGPWGTAGKRCVTLQYAAVYYNGPMEPLCSVTSGQDFRAENAGLLGSGC